MIHSNPFTQAGHDLHELDSRINQKADSSELASLRSNVDGLESALRELSSAFDGLRYELQALQETVEQQKQALETEAK